MLNRQILAAALSGALLIASFSHAHAQVAEVSPKRASGGHVRDFKNQKVQPNQPPIPLPKIDNPSAAQKDIISQAERLLENNPSLAVLLVDKGRILFEGYKSPASQYTEQFSWSMSKSLTSLTIGALLCDGKIASLDDQSSKYVPDLKGTAYGEATIRQILMMSSGVAKGEAAGNSYKGEWEDIRGGNISIIDALRKSGQRDISSGEEFRYLNNDTQVLGAIAENIGGFSKNFEQYLFQPSRPENPAFWLQDKNGYAMVSAGFSATSRDWVRLALHTLNQAKNGNPCIKGFLKNATTQQIKNYGKTGTSFSGYGYQIWTNLSIGDGKSFWWNGYGGQRMGIHPETERIIFVSSYRESYMDSIYRLFEEFRKLPPQ
jgi:CubicO group peptidase (beta-lactamase class C family)